MSDKNDDTEAGVGFWMFVLFIIADSIFATGINVTHGEGAGFIAFGGVAMMAIVSIVISRCLHPTTTFQDVDKERRS